MVKKYNMRIKHKKTNSRKKRTRKRRGGATGLNKTQDNKKGLELAKGFLMQIKLAVAERISMIINGPITTRIRDKFLTGFPDVIRQRLSLKLDDIAFKVVKDLSTKGLSVLENMLRASPGFGNAYSLVAAVDKAVAMVRNAKRALNKIAQDVENAKEEMRAMGLDPDSVGIPSVPQIEAPAALSNLTDKVSNLTEQAQNAATDLSNQAQDGVMNVADQAQSELPQAVPISGLPQVPQMPQVAQINVPNANALPGNLSSMANSSIPGPMQNNVMKGGNTKKYKQILNRTQRSINNFHNSTRRHRK